MEVIDKRRERLRVRPESEEDLWILKTILRPGDYVIGKTYRDVAKGGKGEKEKRAIIVKIAIKNVEFQPFTGKLRLFGVIVEGPEEYGVKGKHQSILLVPGKEVVIEREGGWPNKVIEKLREAGPRGRTVIAAVDYDEYAIAVLSPHGVKFVVDTGTSLPGKDDPSREQEVRSLVERIANLIVRTASEYKAPIAVVVGPGFLKKLVAEKVKGMAPNLRLIVDESSMGGRAGVEEAMRRPSIWSVLQEYAIAEAEEVLAQAMKEAAHGGERLATGVDEALVVSRMGAVDRMVVVDELIYALDDDVRRKVSEILDEVEKRGGKVVIIPRDSPIGERIWMMGGIVALLRFPVPPSARVLDAGD